MISHVKAHPRLIISAITGCLAWIALPMDWRPTNRVLFSWDAFLALYLILVLIMVKQSDIQKIRTRAALEDQGRFTILLLTIACALTSLAAIIAELASAKQLSGTIRNEHIALAGITVFLSWMFLQTIFALHYAH